MENIKPDFKAAMTWFVLALAIAGLLALIFHGISGVLLVLFAAVVGGGMGGTRVLQQVYNKIPYDPEEARYDSLRNTVAPVAEVFERYEAYREVCSQQGQHTLDIGGWLFHEYYNGNEFARMLARLTKEHHRP